MKKKKLIKEVMEADGSFAGFISAQTSKKLNELAKKYRKKGMIVSNRYFKEGTAEGKRRNKERW